ncbi:MAG: hypothetical protein EOO60_13005 [Hymenobacter sp.]|nr:MAG: hypothetical protein EOO60_13005 [Hymenobacter sp.]
MYAPRRHVRRLLLPPGWVALGFLLLLGCQALLTHRRQLQPYSVMQLAMLPLQPDKAISRRVPVYGSITELNKFRPWRDAEFTGTSIKDFINAASAETAIEAIKADTGQAGGVRIRFGQHATYSNLIRVLDMMNYLNQKIYWLDIRHNPTTLYAITNKYVPIKSSAFPALGCLLYNDVFLPSPPAPTWRQLLIKEIAGIWQQAWRLTTLLFIVIIVLSIYRLAYLRPTAH